MEIGAHLDWNTIDFDQYFLPGLSIDTVIFGFHDRKLMVMLIQYKNTNYFSLPGGFIFKNENGNDAALRVLKERTELADIYLEQFNTFTDAGRSDPSFFREIMKARGVVPSPSHFLLRRFVSIGYYALIDFTKAASTTGELADECKWHDLKNLPPLLQDHGIIIEKALSVLQENLDKKLVAFNLLPNTFTIGEVQALYETILQKQFRRTSFQRRMLGLGILEKVAKKTGVAHKAPYLYKFLSY